VAPSTVKNADLEFTRVEAGIPAAQAEDVPPRGMGWLPDLPDIRDYTVQSEPIRPMTEALGLTAAAPPAALPATVDLRNWFSPIDDQGQLGSCTAHAGTGLYEYFERRAHNAYVDGSRLFLYKVTRDLLGFHGDTGAFLRSTMGAMAMFGLPPEKYCKYDITKFDKEPSAFLYAAGQSFQAVKYYRLDPPGTAAADLLLEIRKHLAAGLPSMFGFTVYSSISQANATGAIPMPAPGEKVVGGHAICVAGYDDSKVVKNTGPGGPKSKGAFLIRNSWGTGWGMNGYGWLPYDYVLTGLAEDWWTLIRGEWVDTQRFGF